MSEFKGFDKSFSLQGKNALITGAAAGIGQAVAELYAEKGANIVAVDLSDDVQELKEKIEGFGVKFISIKTDITKMEELESAVDKAVAELGKIDILVNSAGVALLDAAKDLSADYWNKTMDVNLTASFMISQLVGRHMIENDGGKIVNMASQAGVVALDKHVAYCASKAAIISMTQVLAMEWAKYNINVNAISPTVILTELGKKAWAGQVGEDMKKQIPIGRFGYPEEVAACALFLASDAADMITGENLVIDGGYTII